jgi:hypothetical protein
MRVIKYVEFNWAIIMNSMQDQAEIKNRVMDQDMATGTEGSVSNGRNTNSHGTQQKSQDDYIKEFQAEIERLKADSGKARKTRRQHQHRN